MASQHDNSTTNAPRGATSTSPDHDHAAYLDRGEFLTRFNELEKPLRSYLYSVTRNYHDMNDLAQNVWRVLWEKLDAYDPERPFRGWAFGVARMEALKWRQKQARSKLVLDEEAIARLAETAEQEAEIIQARAEFLPECLDNLNRNYRTVLDLKYAADLKIAAIAEKLGRSVAAIEMSLVRARRQVRACIEAKMRHLAMDEAP